MPRGPRLVRMASATAVNHEPLRFVTTQHLSLQIPLAASMLLARISAGLLLVSNCFVWGRLLGAIANFLNNTFGQREKDESPNQGKVDVLG